MRRRSRVAVGIKDVPEQPQSVTDQVSGFWAMMPKSSAHETSTLTPCAACGGACEPASIYWGCWRVHRGCQTLLSDPVARLVAAGRTLGVDLSRQDATLLLEAGLAGATTYAGTHPEPTWSDADPMRSRIRWRHVDGDHLRAAVEKLEGLRADAGLVETYCATGSCAWCGRLESKGWSDRGHRWADGTAAPLCADCVEVYDRAGEVDPAWWEGQRPRLAEAMTGVPVPMGTTPPTVRAFAEVDDGGTGEPWSHLPADAVEAYRWSAWAMYNGAYAPEQHRAEALARARVADAAMAARMAATQTEQRAREDVYGFASTERSAS